MSNVELFLWVLFIVFGVFIVILHYMRRREMTPEYNRVMDLGDIDVIRTLIWFFKKIKERKKKKKEK